MPERIKAQRIVKAMRYNLRLWADHAAEIGALLEPGSPARQIAAHLELNIRQASASIERLAAMDEMED